MNNLVTFNQAEELKYLGFNLDCLYYYDYFKSETEVQEAHYSDNEMIAHVRDLNQDFNKANYTCSAPSVSDALQYIRDYFDLMCGVSPDVQWGEYRFWHSLLSDDIKLSMRIETSINTYDNYLFCESALLTSILEYLKEKKL